MLRRFGRLCLVQLYEATEQKEKAAEWRKKLEAVRGAEPQVQP
jgi:hypothetical protein